MKDCYHILINLSADETLHQVISLDWSAVWSEWTLINTYLKPTFYKQNNKKSTALRDVVDSVLISSLKKTCYRCLFLVLSHPGFGGRCQSSSSVVKEPLRSRVPVLWPDLHHPVQPDSPWEDLQDCVQGDWSTHFYQGWEEVWAHTALLVIPVCWIVRDEVFLCCFRSFRRRLVWLSWWRSSVLKVTTTRLSSTTWALCCPTWHSCPRPETSWWTRTGDWSASPSFVIFQSWYQTLF